MTKKHLAFAIYFLAYIAGFAVAYLAFKVFNLGGEVALAGFLLVTTVGVLISVRLMPPPPPSDEEGGTGYSDWSGWRGF